MDEKNVDTFILYLVTSGRAKHVPILLTLKSSLTLTIKPTYVEHWHISLRPIVNVLENAIDGQCSLGITNFNVMKS